MLDGLSWSLLLAAASVAFVHTVLGPDHYLPFAMLARARGWTTGRTVSVTVLCGIGHVLSSLLLGSIGLAFGVAVSRLENVETGRAGLAAWALVAFGLAYAAWGTRRALRRKRGIEPHTHEGHVHVHSGGDEPHRHQGSLGSSFTFWALLSVFVLGPCEPLIPLFMLPASRGRWDLALLSAAVFGVTTLVTMVGATLAATMGVAAIAPSSLTRWSHTLVGGVIAASGLAVIFLGL